MKSSRSRSRSKNNRSRGGQPSGGNVVNRVFDSSGPEGKVRGTPQQVIEKYNQLARDAQLSNDRVAMENFQQHAEHYLRLLSEAQREIDSRREEQERQNRERQAERDRERTDRQERDSNQPQQDGGDQTRQQEDDRSRQRHGDNDHARQRDDNDPSRPLDDPGEEESNLVETPESKPKPKRAPRKRKPKPDEGGDRPEAAE